MSDSDKESMMTEIEVLKQLDHPNIVRLYDVYEDQKYICLVMELMNGEDLFQYLQKENIIPENKAREIIKILIDSIRYCHLNGIIHRDIKPANLMFSSKNR